jgi:Undecaprenyl-phosphate glucose phosphotransferase
MVLDIVALTDIFLVIIAALLAKFLYLGKILESEQSPEPYLIAGILAGVGICYAYRRQGLYTPAAIINAVWRPRDTIVYIGLAFLTLIAIAYGLKLSSDFSRGWLFAWFGLSVVLIWASRVVFAQVLNWLSAAGSTIHRIAIVTEDGTDHGLTEKLSNVPALTVVGVFQSADQPAQGVGNIADLIQVGQRNEIDEIIICAQGKQAASTARAIDLLGILPVNVSLYPVDFDMPIQAVSQVGKANLLRVRSKPVAMRDWAGLVKLFIDFVVSGITVVILAPLMLAIAAAIKLDSKGPVFFRQRRHGYNHRVISVYKFRTMTVLEDGEAIAQARKNDTRVTRVGNFLRKTSLDELPQLFNVLRGEMSLVGPRPHALAHNKEYERSLQRYANRHCVKPGITGWAQINGFRGPTADPEQMHKRVQLDLYYIENWSLWLDVKILALTPIHGFMHPNAL